LNAPRRKLARDRRHGGRRKVGKDEALGRVNGGAGAGKDGPVVDRGICGTIGVGFGVVFTAGLKTRF
jgi:hypothetical protein